MKLVKNDFVEVKRGFQTGRFNALSILYREDEHNTNLLDILYIDTYIEEDGYFVHRGNVTIPKEFVRSGGMSMEDDVLYIEDINRLKTYVGLFGTREWYEYDNFVDMSLEVVNIFQRVLFPRAFCL